VAAVRGRGLLLGAELEDGNAAGVAAAALEAGLVVNAVTASAIRLAPPLLVSAEEVDEAIAILALAIVRAGVAGPADSGPGTGGPGGEHR